MLSHKRNYIYFTETDRQTEIKSDGIGSRLFT